MFLSGLRLALQHFFGFILSAIFRNECHWQLHPVLSPSSPSSGNEQDYEQWLAHSTDEGGSERNGCVLGVKETYRRLKKQSVCRNGKSFVVSKKQSPCLCTRDDYLWCVAQFLSEVELVLEHVGEALTFSLSNSDYGYYPHVNSSECVREPSANKTLEPCLEGEEDELLTAG